ncbi:MAG TPA: GNAT family N-acetyltransferase [Egibacteraceae bacterium]|nr:GNAT family N-acetyltransferase [Egibacteraceae bacterium]
MPAADEAQPVTKVRVRKATASDVAGLAAVMGRAFQEDPVLAWGMPDEAGRRANGARYFELVARLHYLPLGETYVTEDLQAAALWAPPGQWKASPMTGVRILPFLVRATKFGRALKILKLLEHKHAELREPHFHLFAVGTDPLRQGRGYGGALLRHVLDRCDEQGMPAYLEATTERNRALYLRHGFRVMEELRLPEGGPPFWRMWRGSRS